MIDIGSPGSSVFHLNPQGRSHRKRTRCGQKQVGFCKRNKASQRRASRLNTHMYLLCRWVGACLLVEKRACYACVCRACCT